MQTHIIISVGLRLLKIKQKKRVKKKSVSQNQKMASTFSDSEKLDGCRNISRTLLFCGEAYDCNNFDQMNCNILKEANLMPGFSRAFCKSQISSLAEQKRLPEIFLDSLLICCRKPANIFLKFRFISRNFLQPRPRRQQCSRPSGCFPFP